MVSFASGGLADFFSNRIQNVCWSLEYGKFSFTNYFSAQLSIVLDSLLGIFVPPEGFLCKDPYLS